MNKYPQPPVSNTACVGVALVQSQAKIDARFVDLVAHLGDVLARAEQLAAVYEDVTA